MTTDRWRVCGHPVTTGKNRGCTCSTRDPSPWLVTEALNRLAAERREEEETGAHRSPRPAPGHHREQV